GDEGDQPAPNRAPRALARAVGAAVAEAPRGELDRHLDPPVVDGEGERPRALEEEGEAPLLAELVDDAERGAVERNVDDVGEGWSRGGAARGGVGCERMSDGCCGAAGGRRARGVDAVESRRRSGGDPVFAPPCVAAPANRAGGPARLIELAGIVR